MKTVNARGKACPDPAAAVKAAIKAAAKLGETELEVLLDNPVSASSVMRLLESSGFTVQLKDDNGAIMITARKGEQPPKPIAFKKLPDPPPQEVWITSRTQAARAVPTDVAAPAPEPSSGTFSILITGQTLGRDQDNQGNQELGEALMKNFLGALPQMERPPLAVALMNGGVKLALYDSSSCDHLKNLEKKGVSILICGTCANHFNIMDQIGAGSISHMSEIIETLNRAGKIMTL
ncbi:MAG: sulfurtransferase-like selenium metabolism protein YedF [Synergistaceae bacterium]|nr:sulfurtransferase-like selenium metabolism protein YedF [Synergistaceae bacterium]